MGDSDSELFNTISLKSTRVRAANVGGGYEGRGMRNIRRSETEADRISSR